MATKVNTTGFRKKMRQLEKEVRSRSVATVEDLKDLGKNYARSIAPYETGFTVRSIEGRVEETAKGPRSFVFIKKSMKYRPNDGVHRGGTNSFDLVRWMHIPKNKGHFRSGEPQFMFKTKDYLQDKKGVVARGNFSKLNIRG